MDETALRRTWAEIDLDALARNYQQARKITGPGVKYLGVVKADAYGHGAVRISRTLESLGADYLAVSSLDEARELRQNGIQAPILILGHTPPELTEQLIACRITQTVSARAKAEAYSAAASACGGRLKIHIKVDTGMSRLGFLVRDGHFETGVESIALSCRLPGLEPEGIFTHFSAADEDGPADEAYTEEQFRLFTAVLSALETQGISFPLRHCANSGALARYPETYLDMVRPGIALYGAGADRERLGLRPVMALKSSVSTIKIFDPGGGPPHRLRRRAVPGPFQPGSFPNPPGPCPNPWPHLHGYDHGGSLCPARHWRRQRVGDFRRPPASGQAGGPSGDHPLRTDLRGQQAGAPALPGGRPGGGAEPLPPAGLTLHTPALSGA